jgi:predicted CXXCH cytochrome family protein
LANLVRRQIMKKERVIGITVILAFLSLSLVALCFAQKKAPETITLKMEGAKLAPVVFPHITHVEKAKIECVKCHHKEKDPAQPEPCAKCHPPKEAKEGAVALKDAFHKQCIDCHKDMVAKGNKAPTKCTECHKK